MALFLAQKDVILAVFDKNELLHPFKIVSGITLVGKVVSLDMCNILKKALSCDVTFFIYDVIFYPKRRVFDRNELLTPCSMDSWFKQIKQSRQPIQILNALIDIGDTIYCL